MMLNRQAPPPALDEPPLLESLPPAYVTSVLGERVRAGLTASPKTLPSSLFYDQAGDLLFLQITTLPEYYPTRAEQQILDRYAPEIARATGAASLVEIGAGAAHRTRVLLDALTAAGTLRQYTALDVSRSVLRQCTAALRREYPGTRVRGVLADFQHPFDPGPGARPRLVAFLGGTLGNLDPRERAAFYVRVRPHADALLLGVDLVKDPGVLVAAYDDAQGVTAAFNRNALSALNRLFAADFDPDAFEHVARWDAEHERVEMWLRARSEQQVKIPRLALRVRFAPGEAVRTEICCKFRRAGLAGELAAAGFAIHHWWSDPGGNYALALAAPIGAGTVTTKEAQ